MEGVERDRVVQHKRPGRDPAERKQVRATSQSDTEVFREYANVGSFAAGHAQASPPAMRHVEYLDRVDLDLTRRARMISSPARA